MKFDLDEFMDDNQDIMDSLNGGTVEGQQTYVPPQTSRGGFEDMTDEDIQKFQTSKDFQEYSVKIEDVKQEQANANGKSVQEILGLSKKHESVMYSYNSIQCYDIDVEIYEDIVSQSPVMMATLQEGESVLQTFKYLHQDIYFSLFKYKAILLPEDKMHISTRLNRKIMSILLNTPEFISLRKTCRNDEFNAALGTEIIGKEAIEIIKEALKKVQDLQKKQEAMDSLLEQEEQMDTLAEEIDELDELLENAKQAGDNKTYAQYSAKKDAATQNMQQLKALANKIAEECDELITDDSLASEISTVIGTQLDPVSMEVQQTSDICQAWGLCTGDKCRVAYQNKKDAIEKIRHSTKLSKFTDIIGRFKESAITEQKKKAKDGLTEIKSVTTGDKIENTLPSDRMNLCQDIRKKDFYRRMTEHSLLTYKKDSHKSKNKGPIIVCVDTSGSMEGDAEIWSKALTIGILEVAQLQKRDFACIIYSTSADDPIIIRKDEINPEKVIMCAENFHDGGTSFEAPLSKALELIKDSTFKDADIVFVTDGDCYVSDSFKTRFNHIKEEKEFKTLGVQVNMGSRNHSTSKTLSEFCDTITLVSDIADLTNAESNANTAIFGAL